MFRETDGNERGILARLVVECLSVSYIDVQGDGNERDILARLVVECLFELPKVVSDKTTLFE